VQKSRRILTRKGILRTESRLKKIESRASEFERVEVGGSRGAKRKGTRRVGWFVLGSCGGPPQVCGDFLCVTPSTEEVSALRRGNIPTQIESQRAWLA
jgi:hypothetical protein